MFGAFLQRVTQSWCKRTRAFRALPQVVMCVSPEASGEELLPGDVDPHRAGGAGDDLRGGLDVVGVEVLHLGLRDLASLVARDRRDLGLVRRRRALLDPGG